MDLGGHLPANGFQVNQAFTAHQVGCNQYLDSSLETLFIISSSNIMDQMARQAKEVEKEEVELLRLRHLTAHLSLPHHLSDRWEQGSWTAFEDREYG